MVVEAPRLQVPTWRSRAVCPAGGLQSDARATPLIWPVWTCAAAGIDVAIIATERKTERIVRLMNMYRFLTIVSLNKVPHCRERPATNIESVPGRVKRLSFMP